MRLVLDGADITSSTGSAIAVTQADDVSVVLADGSSNSLTDASTYEDTSEDAPNAALFSSDAMVISGTGALSVTGRSNDGIASKDGLVIASGDITVTAVDDGVRGKDFLVVTGGTLDVDATGDGLKADNEDGTNEDGEAVGYVALLGGEVTVRPATTACTPRATSWSTAPRSPCPSPSRAWRPRTSSSRAARSTSPRPTTASTRRAPRARRRTTPPPDDAPRMTTRDATTDQDAAASGRPAAPATPAEGEMPAGGEPPASGTMPEGEAPQGGGGGMPGEAAGDFSLVITGRRRDGRCRGRRPGLERDADRVGR